MTDLDLHARVIPDTFIGARSPVSEQQSGYHRVHVRSKDGDHITPYVPLTKTGKVDRRGAAPWLVKAVWNGIEWYREVKLDGGPRARLVWEGEVPVSLSPISEV